MKKWNLLAMVFVLSALLCLVDIGAAYSGGTWTDLGTLPGGISSVATGINDSGQIVGSKIAVFSGDSHAFLYNPGSYSLPGTLHLLLESD
jgi:probable HAF family extracellular repeat protein